jgi:hypothetical protein
VLAADSRCVAQVPEPLSPRYRSRVREVSTSYRSHGVNHEPESHTSNVRDLLGVEDADVIELASKKTERAL